MSDNKHNLGGEIPGEDESNKSLSLSGIARPEGLPEASEFDDGPRAGKSMLSQGTMLLLAVLLVGGGSLYAMRSTGGGRGDGVGSEVEAKIEQALARLTNSKSQAPDDPLNRNNLTTRFAGTDEIVSRFASDVSQRQVPLEYVKKNPFALPSLKAAAVPGQVVRDDGSLRKLEKELSELKLQTIMQGRVPVAVINGQFLQPGNTVGSFTLKAIQGLTVELEAQGRVFTLKMDEKAAPNTRPRGR